MVQQFFGLRGNALSWAISLCAGSGFLLFGYNQGVMGSILASNAFLDTIGISADDAETISTVVSIYDIGNMVGCLVTAVWGGRLGRKKAILVGCSIAIIGAAIQAASYSVPQLIVARVITGIGNGMNSATIPTWVAETAKSNSRGELVAAQLSIAIFGIVISYWINYAFHQLEGDIVWRFPIAFQIVFALGTVISLPFLPESPRFLYANGKHEEGDKVLEALADEPLESTRVHANRSEILASIAVDNALGEFSLKNLIRDKSGQQIQKRIGLAMLIQVIQEMTGTNIIVKYSSTIFLNLGIEGKMALKLGGAISICFWVGSVIGVFLVERIGRKKLLYSGTIPVCIGYIIYMIMVKESTTAHLWVAFAATCVILLAFGWSWLPGAWIYGPELLPIRYRHVGAAMNAFCNWTFVFVTVKIGPIGIANLGWRFYIVFIIMTAVQLPIVYFLYPETKGLSLEEIDRLFIKDADISSDIADKAQSSRDAEQKRSAQDHVEAIEA